MDRSRLPPIDLRQLGYFIAVAEHGSISAAAAALGLAQPSLSEHLGRLEAKLEVSLIIRGPRGIQLTQAGLALANHGREILRVVDAAIDDVRHLGDDARGPVSIGFPPTLGLLLSVPLAETVQNDLPNVRLRVSEGLSGHIFEWINTDQLDLGCVYEIPDGAQLWVQPLLTEDLFLVTARDNWGGEIGPNGRAIEPITLAQIAPLPLVLPSRPHGAREVIERFAKASGVKLNIKLEIDSLPQIIAMVDRASGYAILPHAAVFAQVTAGNLALVRIIEPTIQRTAYLVRKRSHLVTRASVAVEKLMSTIIREMVDRHQLEARLPTAG